MSQMTSGRHDTYVKARRWTSHCFIRYIWACGTSGLVMRDA